MGNMNNSVCHGGGWTCKFTQYQVLITARFPLNWQWELLTKFVSIIFVCDLIVCSESTSFLLLSHMNQGHLSPSSLLAGMCLLMLGQMGLLSETLATQLARKGLLSCVGSHMYIHAVLILESLVTYMTVVE